MEKRGDVFVIAPEAIDVRRTEKSPERLAEIPRQGAALTRLLLPKLTAYLEG
jgi:predicted patatin/cPLA2 family phospholipase